MHIVPVTNLGNPPNRFVSLPLPRKIIDATPVILPSEPAPQGKAPQLPRPSFPYSLRFMFSIAQVFPNLQWFLYVIFTDISAQFPVGGKYRRRRAAFRALKAIFFHSQYPKGSPTRITRIRPGWRCGPTTT